MKSLKIILLFCLVLPIGIGCSEDNEESYPSIISDFACINTAAHGAIQTLSTDDGAVYTVANSQSFISSVLVADTTYRVVCRYVIGINSQIELFAIANAVAPNPIPLESIDSLIQDPVELQSIWCSGNYINCILNIMALEESHYIHFIETSPSDARKLEIELYHDRNDDIEGYTQNAYCSIPLQHYDSQLQIGDTIVFSLNTYNGKKSYEFIY